MTSGRALLLIAFVCLVGFGLFSFIGRAPDIVPPALPTIPVEAENSSSPIEQPIAKVIEEPIKEEKAPTALPILPPVKTPVTVRRLMVFTPSGPLLLDFDIQIEGASHSQKIRQFSNRLRKAADADGDGKTTWDELIDNQPFLSGPLGGGGQQTSRTDRRRWRELYDVDGDGRVDRGEALAWFDREANGGKVGLTLLGQRAYTPSLVSSATWRTLDADGNGSLTPDEITEAPDRLLARDVNDDFVVAPAELLSLADLARLRLETGPGGNQSNITNDTTFQAAMLIDREADTRDARNTLARMRVGGGGVYGEGAFGVAKQLFGKMDTNANGQIGQSEWAHLRKSPPHIQFTIRLSTAGVTADTDKPYSSSLALEEQGITLLRHEETNQSSLTIAPAPEGGYGLGGELFISMVDETRGEDAEMTSAKLFIGFDDDGDDSLNEEELQKAISSGQLPLGNITTASSDSLEGYDTDGDNAANHEELTSFISDTRTRQRLSLTVVVNDAADPLFAALDLDGDGRLGEREIAESGKTLAAASNGESLRPGEAPWLMRLTLYRTTRQLTPTEAPPSRDTSLRSAKNLPVWFAGADTNRDGDLSRREFIGSSDHFAELDTDGDGFISSSEALGR